jgi:NTP pyrophosphatase (non-canonical NTP hydrolase)
VKLLDEIIKFNEDRDWRHYHLAKNLAISLVLEATEILEIFQWTKDHKVPEDKKKQLEEEVADAYYWILLIAHDNGIDLNKALRKKMKQNAKKYPVEKIKGTWKKYSEIK